MAVKLVIDDKLLKEAQSVGGHKTKRAAVAEALNEYIQRRKQLRSISLFGKVDYNPDYDYKATRSRKWVTWDQLKLKELFSVPENNGKHGKQFFQQFQTIFLDFPGKRKYPPIVEDTEK